MGRHAQPEIRRRLLDACTEHALEHGLPERLGPLAAAAGTSSRMLVYHFGTRDDLLRAILREARRRQVEAFTELLRVRPGEPYGVTLQNAWTAMAGPEGRRWFRIFTPLHDRAGGPLWPGFRREATTDWLGPLQAGLGSPERATLALAVIRGLLMDLDATRDAERADRAFADFAALLG